MRSAVFSLSTLLLSACVGSASNDLDSEASATTRCFGYGVSSRGPVTLASGALLSGWSGGRYHPSLRAPTRVQIQAEGPCALTVDQATLDGAVTLGSLATAAADVCLRNGGVISGEVEVPSSSSVEGYPWSPEVEGPRLGALSLSGSETAEIDGDAILDSVELRDGATLNLTADARLEVRGDLLVDAASLVLAPGVQVELRVWGEVEVSRSGRVGSSSQSDDLVLFHGGETFAVSSGAAVGALLATGGALRVEGGAFYGAVEGAGVEVTRGGALFVNQRMLCD
ncbi:MAG: hypothetical protein H6741_03135 [Alphaproteobacteria bacterium]|nr:hypothetical protein [Alphaproteobacteria bacterium]